MYHETVYFWHVPASCTGRGFWNKKQNQWVCTCAMLISRHVICRCARTCLRPVHYCSLCCSNSACFFYYFTLMYNVSSSSDGVDLKSVQVNFLNEITAYNLTMTKTNTLCRSTSSTRPLPTIIFLTKANTQAHERHRWKHYQVRLTSIVYIMGSTS